MNMLVDALPTYVFIDNKKYEINHSFRTSILFEIMMNDSEIDNEDKIHKALELYYPIIPNDFDKAIDKMLWFYRCGKEIKQSKGTGASNSNKNNIYSYEFDDEYIYAAFLDQYNIDLQDIENLHWWKFKALFNSLKSDNKMVEIMGYRAIAINSDMTKEQKNFYNKMKKEYEIPTSKDEKEKINAIEEALLNGGDLTNLL